MNHKINKIRGEVKCAQNECKAFDRRDIMDFSRKPFGTIHLICNLIYEWNKCLNSRNFD